MRACNASYLVCRVTGLLLPSLLVVSRPAVAEMPSACDILKRMIRAEGQITLRGRQETSYTFSQDGKARTVKERVYLQAPHMMRVETVSPADRKGLVTVSNGEVRRTYLPKRNLVFETPMPPRTRVGTIKKRRLRLLAANFETTLKGTETVGGRKTYVVELRPTKFEGGVHRLWIDTATFARLKEERLSTEGRRLLVKQFTEVTLPKTLDAALFELGPAKDAKIHRAEADGGNLLSTKALLAKAPFKAVAPERLPGGFLFESARLQKRGDRDVVWVRYIDGLNFVSLFQTPTKPGGTGKQHAARHGALTWDAKGINFVVVGSLPRSHLETIRKALSR